MLIDTVAKIEELVRNYELEAEILIAEAEESGDLAESLKGEADALIPGLSMYGKEAFLAYRRWWLEHYRMHASTASNN
jgi:hypothetical protein